MSLGVARHAAHLRWRWFVVAWRLALLAPNLAPGDIVSRVNVRTAVGKLG